jgi:outer membrane protein OmpA-like peptidoglycan-associated protein
MRKIINLVCILGTAGLLAACSYFDTGEEVDVSSQPAETIDLQNGDIAQSQLAPVEYKDVADAVRRTSDGRVEIFPLDGSDWSTDGSVSTSNDFSNDDFSSNEPIDIQPVQAVPLYQEGYNSSNAYPGVEVYPLDDQMAGIVNPRLGPTSVQPLTPLATSSDFVALGVPGGGPTVVYFDHDSVTLNSSDASMLTALGRSYGGQDISVVGHASVTSSVDDPIQRKIINLKISMDRAFAVARALIEGGIPPERIETKGYGEVRPPLASNQPVEVASRRVEIYGVSVQ